MPDGVTAKSPATFWLTLIRVNLSQTSQSLSVFHLCFICGSTELFRLGKSAIDVQQSQSQLCRMSPKSIPVFSIISPRPTILSLAILIAGLAVAPTLLRGEDSAWRTLPLVTNGKVDTNWIHLGYGGFVVDDGAVGGGGERRGG